MRRGVWQWAIVAVLLFQSVDRSVVDAQATGPVAAYGFDEGAGALLTDASGNNNTGAVSGATWIAGRYGSALLFDGVDDVATVQDAPSLDLATAMTLEAWVFPVALSNWRTIML